MPGDRRTAEIQRTAIAVTHQFYAIGIEQFVRISKRLGQGRNARARCRQRLRHGANRSRRRQGFITLQVHDNAFIVPAT